MNYVGRFAPSPTGPLHFGSLVAALASYLDARHHQGRWLLRIEDLDPPRESPEAPAQILRQLEAFGLEWDGDVLYQSSRLEAYNEALATLERAGHLYRCDCPRKSFDKVYPNRCRDRQNVQAPFARRVRIPAAPITFDDLLQGPQAFDLMTDCGDFVVHRKDGLHAYQLAVVVDDAASHVTHVIRGIDLLDSTPRQLCLFNYLCLPAPIYGHFPVVLGEDGQKLSKQAFADPVQTHAPEQTLNLALRALGQPQVDAARDDLLRTAVGQWQRSRVPAATGIRLSDLAV